MVVRSLDGNDLPYHVIGPGLHGQCNSRCSSRSVSRQISHNVVANCPEGEHTNHGPLTLPSYTSIP